MNTQSQHAQVPFEPQQFPIVLVCDGIKSPANIGSIFRLADSFGVSNLFFCGIADIQSKRMERTARSTHLHTPYNCCPKTQTVLDQLRADKYELIALEITSKSVPLVTQTFDVNQKIALLVGEENMGLQATVLSQVDRSIHIAMYGNNSSMNVAMATGIALYEITKQIKHKPL